MTDPREFLNVADDWSVGTREAEWRSAVSRAYYAAFHVAVQVFRQAGFVVPHGGPAHAYLWLRLSNSGHAGVDNVGRALNELRGDRNRADYELRNPVDRNLALDAVAAAAAIIDLLEEVETTPHVLAQITATMRIYERDVLREVTWRP